MDIKKEVKNIEENILKLKVKKTETIRNYLEPHIQKMLDNLKEFEKKSDFKFEVETYYYDNEDEKYIIRLNISEDRFKIKLKHKHKLSEVARDGIDDDFANQNIYVIGVI